MFTLPHIGNVPPEIISGLAIPGIGVVLVLAQASSENIWTSAGVGIVMGVGLVIKYFADKRARHKEKKAQLEAQQKLLAEQTEALKAHARKETEELLKAQEKEANTIRDNLLTSYREAYEASERFREQTTNGLTAKIKDLEERLTAMSKQLDAVQQENETLRNMNIRLQGRGGPAALGTTHHPVAPDGQH